MTASNSCKLDRLECLSWVDALSRVRSEIKKTWGKVIKGNVIMAEQLASLEEHIHSFFSYSGG